MKIKMGHHEVAIMDYASGTIFLRDVPIEMRDDEMEDIAQYFRKILELQGEFEWMMSDDIAIDDERGDRSMCCNAEMINGTQCENCGSNGE